MKFKKIGKDKIRCLISKEEMQENGMELGDFVGNQEKTQAFIREVLKEACETLGIENKAMAYSVQMTVTPDGDVALLISPDTSAGLEYALERLKKELSNMAGGLDEDDEDESTSFNSSAKAVSIEKASGISDKSDEVTDQYKDTPLWVSLPSLDAAIDLCRKIPKYDGIDSVLYRFGNEYYIKLNFELSRRQISSIILVVAEYAISMFTETFDGAFMVEHGTVICKDCVNKLADL